MKNLKHILVLIHTFTNPHICISAIHPHIRTSAYLLFILTFAHLLIGTFTFAQQSNVDSLLALLKKDKEDTNKVNHLNLLCRQYTNNGSYDSALYYANDAKTLAETIIAGGAKQSAVILTTLKKSIVNSCNNIGVVYLNQGDYPKALNYYFQALKTDEELGNKYGIAKALGYIGIVNLNRGDYSKALYYYLKALKMAEDLLEQAKRSGNAEEIKRDKNLIASWLGGIGLVYFRQDDFQKALYYLFKALKLSEEIEAKNLIASVLGNIGSIYAQQDEYSKGLDYFLKALKLDEEIGNKKGIAIRLGNIGSLYSSTKRYAEAEKYLLDALKLAQEIGAQDYERQIEEELLTELYIKTNRYQLALEHYKRGMVLKDTLFSEEKNKEITRKEMTYEFEKKEAAAKAEADKQAAVAEAEKKKQQVILYSVIGGLLIVVVFAGFIFRALRITQKQKHIIEQQKKIVEEKQSEILASIRYAKRIQDAILPTEKYIDKTLKRLMK